MKMEKTAGSPAMRGKVVLVTGGGQGIGKAIVRRFLRVGAAVFFIDRDKDAGRETQKEYAALGRLGYAAADVSDEAQVRSTVAKAVRVFGGLDVLVNNAATGCAHVPPTELALEDWNRVLAVNLTGPFLCAKHAAPHLRKRHGLIVNIASTRAMMSEANTVAYSASKGGLVALTHSLAISLGPDIRVNCVSPGWIETGDWKKKAKRRKPVHSEADRLQHPCGRVGEPDDIASMVLHLATDGGFITGADFTIDGGMTRRMIYV
jgi:NAD(P)-dependent dehydrogenase (short-subunit alcohol dehydrogenase family)